MSRAPSQRPAFVVRVGALLIDYALILGWMALIAVATLALSTSTGESVDWLVFGTAGAQALGFLVLVLPVGVYLYATEASGRHATVGKRVLGLRVVEATTLGPPSRSGVLVRTIVKLLPWEIAHFAVWNVVALAAAGAADLPAWLLVALVAANALPLVYVGMVAWQTDRRGPHDLAAGTRVIRSRAPRYGGRRADPRARTAGQEA